MPSFSRAGEGSCGFGCGRAVAQCAVGLVAARVRMPSPPSFPSGKDGLGRGFNCGRIAVEGVAALRSPKRGCRQRPIRFSALGVLGVMVVVSPLPGGGGNCGFGFDCGWTVVEGAVGIGLICRCRTAVEGFTAPCILRGRRREAPNGGDIGWRIILSYNFRV